jgi:quinol monooxygenase YgiN
MSANMSSEQIFMCARFQAKPEKLEELRARLLEMVTHTSQEEDCLFYNLHVDRTDPTIFYFLEGWKNQRRSNSMTAPLMFKQSSVIPPS